MRLHVAFRVVFALTVVDYLVMVLWSLPQLRAAGLVPFDLRLCGYSPVEARAYLEALGPDQRAFYVGVQHRLDLVFPGLWPIRCCSRAGWPGWPVWWRWRRRSLTGARTLRGRDAGAGDCHPWPVAEVERDEETGMTFTVAIDGPAAAGKGTISKAVAAHFGFAHLDTGLLYRAVGAKVLDGSDPVAAAHALDPADLEGNLRTPACARPRWLRPPAGSR